jgi:hypothetical protein
MLPRLLVLLLPVMLSACADARAPGDVPACTSEAECAKLYRASQLRLQQCLRENVAARGNPNLPVPPECDAMYAEMTGLLSALRRFRDPHDHGAGDGQGGFEVQPLPSATGPAAPP